MYLLRVGMHYIGIIIYNYYIGVLYVIRILYINIKYYIDLYYKHDQCMYYFIKYITI